MFTTRKRFDTFNFYTVKPPTRKPCFRDSGTSCCLLFLAFSHGRGVPINVVRFLARLGTLWGATLAANVPNAVPGVVRGWFANLRSPAFWVQGQPEYPKVTPGDHLGGSEHRGLSFELFGTGFGWGAGLLGLDFL